jgi:hypothetical protein
MTYYQSPPEIRTAASNTLAPTYYNSRVYLGRLDNSSLISRRLSTEGICVRKRDSLISDRNKQLHSDLFNIIDTEHINARDGKGGNGRFNFQRKMGAT